MANIITKQWRSFWHTMTSNDRHASHDSHYRTGQHVPLSQSRSNTMSSVATSAAESRADLHSYDIEAQNGFVTSPQSPHASSARPSMQRQASGGNMDNKMADVNAGEIQMQSFSDGLPPPPPVSHSWKRIDRWLEDNYEELFENVCEGATINDINELEHQLDCSLPTEVRESIALHDGQERGGLPTGLVFGCMLLDCEEISQEWQQWRTVNEAYFGETQYEIPQAPIKAFAGSSSSVIPVAQAQQSANPNWRQELQDRQDSQPEKAIQKVYAHPAWIPLARDWGGNNICVDLAPGPTGQWGQVILMGRDYDCKYVIARSWSQFLATVADDMGSDKWYIDEETNELKLRVFKQPGVEPAYIDILRWRSDQKYGRRKPRKGPLRINSNVSGAPNGYSPYASPTSDDRGRSPHRYTNGKAPITNSPKMGISSPLARVQEETSQSPTKGPQSEDKHKKKKEKLVDVATPTSARPSDEIDRQGSLPVHKSKLGGMVQNSDDIGGGESDALVGGNPNEPTTNGGAEEMKNIEI
ncbi:1,3-beta-glucan biosynthesis protein [Polychaeton citri CBS 116435]|uniref:1,3-beta-glucan biosynthesis protein n=1 Tax=Polychaeton citri CBS 116435 TaxID=1314669 RepID=A0A9P4Q566_9PEZI|nr:1,3-beta-glucan biosynthesis protein [Polychaeton citri CBS 116435]